VKEQSDLSIGGSEETQNYENVFEIAEFYTVAQPDLRNLTGRIQLSSKKALVYTPGERRGREGYTFVAPRPATNKYVD
jgi:hypothetical protein